MVKGIRLVSILFILAIALSFVYAEETKITVKTDKGYNYSVTLGIFDIYGNTIESQDGYINPATGEKLFTFESPSRRITFSTYIHLGKYLKIKRFGDYLNYSTGTDISLNAIDPLVVPAVVPVNVTTVPVVNSTPEPTPVNDTNVIQTASVVNSMPQIINSNNASLTGNAISNSGENTSIEPQVSFGEKTKKIWAAVDIYAYYVLGAIAVIVVLLLIIFGIKKFMSSEHPSYSGNKIHSGEDIKITKDPRIEKELGEAQRKIKEAQEVIDKISHRETKVVDAEKKFEEARKELERAKRSY